MVISPPLQCIVITKHSSSVAIVLLGCLAKWLNQHTACRIVVADILMVVTGLFGGVNTHKFKWGYFTIACFFQVVLTIGLLFPGMRAAFARGGGMSKVYAGLAAYLGILWFGYPIVWGLAEGSNTISSDAEVLKLLYARRMLSAST